jgi:zinc transporter, ZIP family
VVVWLLLAGGYNALRGEGEIPLRYGLLGGLAGFAATALGALLALVLRNLTARTEDSLLGFAAGMMLAASSFSLILPGIEAAEGLTGSAPLGAMTVVLGLGSGCC